MRNGSKRRRPPMPMPLPLPLRDGGSFASFVDPAHGKQLDVQLHDPIKGRLRVDEFDDSGPELLDAFLNFLEASLADVHGKGRNIPEPFRMPCQ